MKEGNNSIILLYYVLEYQLLNQIIDLLQHRIQFRTNLREEDRWLVTLVGRSPLTEVLNY